MRTEADFSMKKKKWFFVVYFLLQKHSLYNIDSSLVGRNRSRDTSLKSSV